MFVSSGCVWKRLGGVLRQRTRFLPPRQRTAPERFGHESREEAPQAPIGSEFAEHILRRVAPSVFEERLDSDQEMRIQLAATGADLMRTHSDTCVTPLQSDVHFTRLVWSVDTPTRLIRKAHLRVFEGLSVQLEAPIHRLFHVVRKRKNRKVSLFGYATDPLFSDLRAPVRDNDCLVRKYVVVKVGTPNHVAVAIWERKRKLVTIFDPSGSHDHSGFQDLLLEKLLQGYKFTIRRVIDESIQHPGDVMCQTWIWWYLVRRLVHKASNREIVKELKQTRCSELRMKVLDLFNELL